jgi:hypothetical protein
MERATPDLKIQEALSTVGQYLSDMIPPVHAAESVTTLLEHPPQLIASEIVNWVPAQLRATDSSATVADYFFHAVSKLYYLAQLQLVPEKALAPYLNQVKQRLLDFCPPNERQFLQDSFSGLGIAETPNAVPINLIHRQTNLEELVSEVSESRPHELPRNYRRTILRDRLKAEARQPATMPAVEGHEDPMPQLIANVASDVHSNEEFRKLQDNLKSLGMNSGTDHIYRTLSQSLPGWMIATAGAGTPKSQNPAMEAMRQIIRLADDRWEGSKRYQEMVQAAIEQFNQGSLTRAATVLDLALNISSDSKLDPTAVLKIRRTAHESIDLNRVRDLAKEREKHPLLRKALSFFEEFTAENMLNSLQTEEKRDRRRLLLDLIEIHGDVARKMAIERLQRLLLDTDITTDWHFARNLVCILTRIPRAADVPPKAEIDLVAPLMQLSLPPPLLKEAIKYAGQTKCSESEEALISATDRLEKLVLDYADSGKDPAQKVSLLDSTIFALAHYGTPRANARVVQHGTSRYEEMGDTMARLAYFSGQDLSRDRECITALVQFIKSKMPRKLFGVTIQKNDDLLFYAIKALSSTPDVVVRLTLDVVAEQFPETKFGQAAAGALKEFQAMDKPRVSSERMQTSELILFGLPDLLQQLSTSQATGILTLKGADGVLMGTLTLVSGRMRDCSAGRLKGKDAAYQLIEKPVAGTYAFQSQRISVSQDQSAKQLNEELNSIISEGMRRYDELQRARAILPDSARLKRKGPEPAQYGEEKDAELIGRIWEKTAAGVSAEECEAACEADAYRVRTLLARWIEEGALIIEEPPR